MNSPAYTSITSIADLLTHLVSTTDDLNREALPELATEAVVAEQASTSPILSPNTPKAPLRKILTTAFTPTEFSGSTPTYCELFPGSSLTHTHTVSPQVQLYIYERVKQEYLGPEVCKISLETISVEKWYNCPPTKPNTSLGKGSKLTAEVRHNALDYAYFNEHRWTSYHSTGKVVQKAHKQK